MRAIVVGAGAVGLFCAYALGARGAHVTVLEAQERGARPARAASRAAAGMLAPYSESLGERVGAHPRLLDLSLSSLALWRAQGPQLAPGGFHQRGAALTGYPEPALTGLAALVGARGGRAQWRTAPDGAPALYLADESAIDPDLMLAGLARAVAARGGDLQFGARAAVVEAHRVTLADGRRLDADWVIAAPGVWGGDLAACLRTLTPTKGQIAELASEAFAPGEMLRAPDVYVLGRTPGRVLVGASMEPGRDDLHTDQAIIASLVARAAARVPGLGDARLTRAWAGVRPMTADGAPRIGPVDGIVFAYGHSRNGWLLAPITAQIVCAHVFGAPLDDLWASFRP